MAARLLLAAAACAAALALPAAPAAGEEQPAAAAPSPSPSKQEEQEKREAQEKLAHRIAALIKDLGSEEWAVREAAQQALVALGAPAEKALETAADSSDPEVAQRARDALKSIRGTGFIGIYIADGPEPEDAESPRGCAVTGRVELHDANAQDLQPGDVILFVGERRVDGARSLQRIVAATRPGTTAKLKVRREGRTIEVPVRILPWPEDIPRPDFGGE